MKRQHSSTYFYCVLLKEKLSLIKQRCKGFLESNATLKFVTVYHQVCSSHLPGHQKVEFRLLSAKTLLSCMPVHARVAHSTMRFHPWQTVTQNHAALSADSRKKEKKKS